MIEIGRKQAKDGKLYRVISEKVCGIIFYILERSVNDYQKDDFVLWESSPEYRFMEEKERVMHKYNKIR